jgi:hypothetical protein
MLPKKPVLRRTVEMQCLINIRIPNEPQGQRIHTVTRVFGCEAFAQKHVSQMGVATSTAYFCSFTVGVGQTLYGSWDFVVKTWPAAAGVKLIFAFVKLCAA